MADLVTTTHDPAGVYRLELNRPEARNPTSIAMLDAMDAALDQITADEAFRVLVLAGAGKSFCSGLDLAEVSGDGTTIRTLLTRLSEVMRRIRRLDAVTIAEVQGAAIGGGFGFMAACDFKVTHPEAKLGYPPLETCLSPALMAPWLLRTVGPARARALLLTGGTISGRESFALGIATHLTERDTLAATTAEIVRNTLSGGRHAQTAMKRLLNELDDSISDALLDRAAATSADVIAGPEAQERIARIAKRP